jgi:hypothetical protein
MVTDQAGNPLRPELRALHEYARTVALDFDPDVVSESEVRLLCVFGEFLVTRLWLRGDFKDQPRNVLEPPK